MPSRSEQRAERKARRRLEGELAVTLEAMRQNDAAFEMAMDAFAVEELIYRHAALLCHCRAVLQELRGGDATCRSI